jgi:hypothetical protein
MGLTSSKLEEIREKYEDGCIMIFPLELMNQKNWHFNINDRNGYFFVDTITSNSIEEIPEASVIPKFNEVVFHNQIPLCNLINVVGSPVTWNPDFHLSIDEITPPSYIYFSGCMYSGERYSFFRAPSENMTSATFFYQWLQKHLPQEWKHIVNEEMKIFEMDIALNQTIHPDSGLNLVDHYFRHRIPIY